MTQQSMTTLEYAVRCVDVRTWCRVIKRNGLHRPWDLLFPPSRLYAAGSSFEVGSEVCHCVISYDQQAVAVFVLAMRAQDCCLIDVRCKPGIRPDWADVVIDYWQQTADQFQAETLTGPLGAFAFLTDGVAEPGTYSPESIHISWYPEILVASLLRRGYVHAWSGTIWGRHGAAGTAPSFSSGKHSSVRVGSWMNVISIARDLESVLTTAFSTLSWHRGSGAGLPSLVRAYTPIFTPSLALTAQTPEQTVAGAVLMHKDLSTVPTWLYSMPRTVQALWLRIASLGSHCIHASVIGIVPDMRNSRYALDLFEATAAVFASADSVTTSWIRDNNTASRLMAMRAGLKPLQQRFVFRLIRQSCSTSQGE